MSSAITARLVAQTHHGPPETYVRPAEVERHDPAGPELSVSRRQIQNPPGVDELTLEVRTIEVTGSHIGDGLILPDLLNQMYPDQAVGPVTADWAYVTRKCLDTIAERDAHAVIPPRKKMPSSGSRHLLGVSTETKLCGHADIWPHPIYATKLH